MATTTTSLVQYIITDNTIVLPKKSLARDTLMEIPLAELHPFAEYPFRNKDDAAMWECAESIKEGGAVVPCLVRPLGLGGYEVITGQRTVRACELACRSTMPAIVSDMDDAAATITMVNANLPQEKALPSELGWALRMKLEALCHRGRKADGIDPGTLSVEVLMTQTGKSKNQIYRYVHLTELVPDLLDMVDDRKIGFSIAADHLYRLSRKEQAWLIDSMEKYEATPSASQAIRLKSYSINGDLTAILVDEIMAEVKKETDRVTLAGNRLQRYFPKHYTPKKMETVIIQLLEAWSKSQAVNG